VNILLFVIRNDAFYSVIPEVPLFPDRPEKQNRREWDIVKEV
jgi:hypothetical protein